MIFAKKSLFRHVIDMGILRAVRSGFITKLAHDVEWDMMRSATGKLLQVTIVFNHFIIIKGYQFQASAGKGLNILSVEDRALTLDDTQGMFLLLGAGFLAGAASLFSEFVGGCFRCCKKIKKEKKRSNSIDSNPRWHCELTPREKLNSLQDSSHVQNYLINLRGEADASVKCEVHEESKIPQPEQKDSYDYEAEIDRLFDLGHLFGEENEIESQESKEEQIIEHNEKLV